MRVVGDEPELARRVFVSQHRSLAHGAVSGEHLGDAGPGIDEAVAQSRMRPSVAAEVLERTVREEARPISRAARPFAEIHHEIAGHADGNSPSPSGADVDAPQGGAG